MELNMTNNMFTVITNQVSAASSKVLIDEDILVCGQIDGLVQDCSNSIANALELLLSCT